MTAKAKRAGSQLLRHVLVVIVGVVMIYPILWLLSSSFKPNDLIFSNQSL